MNISYEKDTIILRGYELKKKFIHILDLFMSVIKLREGDLLGNSGGPGQSTILI